MKLREKIKIVVDIKKQFGFGFAVRYAYYLKTYQYNKYIDFVSDYLKNYFSDELKQFDRKMIEYDKPPMTEIDNIFVCWWQGYENMPLLCKACYKQLQESLDSKYNLIFITKDNYQQYVKIPEYIIEKLNAGLIPVTQFSDVLRQGLIAQNGGLWIDSTVWTNNGINNILPHIDEFWSVKLNQVYNEKVIGQLISSCRWSSFIVGGRKGSPVFELMFSCMCKYYKEHDTAIDYYLQNLLYKLIFDNTKYCAKVIHDLEPSNRYLYDLKNEFNKKFCPARYDEMNQCTSVFKLTYKAIYKENVDGVMTFYKYVIDSLNN